MLIWGIWQGKGKPPFNVYFEPFATEMIDLYENGKQFLISSHCCTIGTFSSSLAGSDS